MAKFVEEAPVSFLGQLREVDAVLLGGIDPAHERIARVHEAGGDLSVWDDALGGEAGQRDEVIFQGHRLVPPFQQAFRVSEFFHLRGLDVENYILTHERDPRSGVLLGLHPGVGRVFAENVGGHRDGVAKLQRGGGGSLHWLTPVLVRALDEELAAEGIGDLIVADLQFERTGDDWESIPLLKLEQAVAVATDDNFDHAALGDRGDLHDDDLARGGVEARLLPGVGAGREIGRVT